MTSRQGRPQASNGRVPTTSFGQGGRIAPGLLLIYLALIIYGSLYPFVGWDPARWPAAIEGLLHWPTWRPRSDMITNLLVYIPLGVLLATVLSRPQPAWQRGLLAIALAAALSLSMELLQAALPGRVASLRDLFWNSLGATLGVFCRGACAESQPLRRTLVAWRRHWLNDDSLSIVGLWLLLLWLLAQWLPLSVDFDLSRMTLELNQLYFRLQQPGLLSINKVVVEFLQLTSLGLLCLAIIRQDRPAVPAWLGLVLLTLVLQILLIDRRVQAERVLAFAVAAPLLMAMATQDRRRFAGLAIGALVLAFVLEGLDSRYPWGLRTRDFNWIPFVGNIGRLHSFPSLAGTLWLFACLAYWSLWQHRVVTRRRPADFPALSGLVLVLGLSFGIEWLQKGYPDRWPDVTDPIIATAGWTLVIWYHASLLASASLGKDPTPDNTALVRDNGV